MQLKALNSSSAPAGARGKRSVPSYIRAYPEVLLESTDNIYRDQTDVSISHCPFQVRCMHGATAAYQPSTGKPILIRDEKALSALDLHRL